VAAPGGDHLDEVQRAVQGLDAADAPVVVRRMGHRVHVLRPVDSTT